MKALLLIFTSSVAVTALFHSSVVAAEPETSLKNGSDQVRGGRYVRSFKHGDYRGGTQSRYHRLTAQMRHLKSSRGLEINALDAALDRFQDAAEDLVLPRRPRGMVIAPSNYDFVTTYNMLNLELENNADTSSILEAVDHAAMALVEGVTLLPNKVVFFTTTRNPIMKNNIVASLDYPHKMLIWQDENDNCFVGYNSQQFLAARYSTDVATNNEIDQIMADVAAAATGTEQNAFLFPSEAEFGRYRRSSQIFIKDSSTSFISTLNRLTTLLEKDEILKPTGGFFVVDNSRATLKAMVAVFGYATPNTLLLQNDPTVGLDLPLRISVIEDANGLVQVATNSQIFLDKRYDLLQAPTEVKEWLKDVVRFLVNHAAGANLPFRSAGSVLATSTLATFDETYTNLQNALATVGTIIAEVDNSPLDGFNKVLFVSFPELDDTILATHPRAALDLPHAVSIWQDDDDGSVYVGFNAPRYIGSRFVVNGIPDALDTAVLEALSTAVSMATDSNQLSFLLPGIREFLRIRESPGHLIRQSSDGDFDAAVTRLLNAITVFGLEKVYDVAAGEAGGDCNDTNNNCSRVIGFRFGPALEDQLLADSNSMGIDLPFKILVVRNALDGVVNVMTNDIEFLKVRHNLSAAVNVLLDSFSEILDTILDVTVNSVIQPSDDSEIDLERLEKQATKIQHPGPRLP